LKLRKGRSSATGDDNGQSYAMTGKEVFMYTGKPYDSTTGLYYYEARYYDDSMGRFVTEDSYSGDKNDPMTMNRYVYGRDNPEKYVDPTGHFMHSSIIGEANPASETITTDCSAGVCTTYTTIVTYDGYVLTSIVATASAVSSSGNQVNYLAIQSTIENPSGLSTTTTTWAATDKATGLYVAQPTTSTSVNNPTTNNAIVTGGVLVVASVITLEAAANGDFGPFSPAVGWGVFGGVSKELFYLDTGPSPTPLGVAEAYVSGFLANFVTALGPILP
jgi:RHS repeat-associated protein